MFYLLCNLGAFHNCCMIGCENVVQAKKFTICFINVWMKKVLLRKHARSEAPVGELSAMICNRSCDMAYVLVRPLCNKSDVVR